LKNTKGLELSSQQMKAASFDKGNALVLSTAGSGKQPLLLLGQAGFCLKISAAKRF